ncbi:GNAT family N-acetyltransferase [Streptomyces sp. 4F14]|uniref:GNAT family N-acetyltransferase n=1 Tax=Streptomyces sp. 4F14 TaxID=3394380 RepID=UPI003A871784
MTTRTRQTVLTRTAVPDDLDAANLMHLRSSAQSRFARYHSARQTVAPREWAHLCDPSQGTTMITVPQDEPARVIAVTHLMRTPVPHIRELGILVEDSWQQQGLGTVLVQYTVDLARTHTLDCRGITAMTGSGNRPVLAILRRLNARVTGRDGATLDVMIPVEAQRHLPLPPPGSAAQ